MSWLAGISLESAENDNLGVDWVLQYEFGDLEQSQAIAEFRTLMADLTEAGLRVQIRHGHGKALLVCIRVPRDHLGTMVQQSRVKDWMYAITHKLPSATETSATAETPAEEIRSIYHAVTWSKELGGAGITPEFGKWERITASFPLHDKDACTELLRAWSRKTVLTIRDLDTIRALFGEKVAFYFAFIQCYSIALVIPAAMGIVGWLYFGPYSIIYGSALCVWCICFVEYWKVREFDLAHRWGVRGVGVLKVNRPQYKWEKEIKDPITGQVTRVFPGWKQFLRQLLLIPFASVAAVALGSLIVVTFASEVFISEVYDGKFQGYLEFAPTIIFSLSLPFITSLLTSIATRLTEYENYRTRDLYDLAQTQKTFVMNFITSFLPTILTAYVYVPFGKTIVPHLDIIKRAGLNIEMAHKDFQVDGSRFQQEVIYLSMTAQIFSFCEEIILPYVKQKLYQKWRNYQDRKAGLTRQRNSILQRLREEADSDGYEVEEDILEMCVQFGYLALFGVAWPLVPLGFLLNNWLELRGDFFKLARENQRPPPIRADSIGPSLLGLDFLAWMGTISTAAIVHIYRGNMEEVHLSSLLLTVFIAEQAYLGIRFIAATAMQKIFAETLYQEEICRHAVRKDFYEMSAGIASGRAGSPGDSPGRVRQRVRFHERVNVYESGTDTGHSDGSPSPTTEKVQDDVLKGSDREAAFWNAHSYDTADAGAKLIRALSENPMEEKSAKRA
ncbi:hypothetical protein N7533_000129 [Penicillium manginii]|uniref:uncharacterized protein n=1 Tax=Penicillium manginii TaxID=203109 RepID=UPI002548EBB8|nr:uncharacterized protein N7533_000129 [Penicillium manginii]KAJ5767546.1 hypothetical protein N7533_000129 [Penicillium manginii]